MHLSRLWKQVWDSLHSGPVTAFQQGLRLDILKLYNSLWYTCLFVSGHCLPAWPTSVQFEEKCQIQSRIHSHFNNDKALKSWCSETSLSHHTPTSVNDCWCSSYVMEINILCVTLKIVHYMSCFPSLRPNSNKTCMFQKWVFKSETLV